MADKPLGLQENFLNSLRRSKSPATIFLLKGVKLQGVVTWFDAFSLLIRRDGNAQLVYKHAISTISPSRPLPDLRMAAPDTASARASLQDQFLAAAMREAEPLTLFLLNGVMLQGVIAGFDQFSLLLERGSDVQLVYKHAISTLQPPHPLDLGSAEAPPEPE